MVGTHDTPGAAGRTGDGSPRAMPDGLWGNPYTLAEYWADRRRWPLPGQQTPADALHELAVMATLADWLRRWLPINIHAALAGGAGVDAVAAATGIAPGEVRSLWEPWADGQVDLWHTSNPHRPIGLNPAERDQVRALFPPASAPPAAGTSGGGARVNGIPLTDNDAQHAVLARGAVGEAVRATRPDADLNDLLTTDLVAEAELAWLATGLLPNAELLSPGEVREICRAIIGRTATLLVLVGWQPPARLLPGRERAGG